MKFQTTKRIMCCLMAALILCFAVVQPLEAQATSIGISTGVIVGIGLEEAVGSVLIGLGVTGTTVAFMDLVYEISKNVPADYIIQTLSGTEYLSAVKYENYVYVAQEFVEWVQSAIWGRDTAIAPSFTASYSGTVDITNDISFSEMFNKVYHPISWGNYPHCYTVRFYTNDNFRGFYYFGDSAPVLEWNYDCYVDYLGQTYDEILSVTVPDNAFLYAYDYFYGMEITSYGDETVYFPDAPDYKIANSVGVMETVAVDGLSYTDSFVSQIDTEEIPWVFPGIHIIILPEETPPETEPEETDPPETDPPESQPAVPPDPDTDPKTPDETGPEETDPAELPETTTPSEPDTDTPEETTPTEVPTKYETYVPIKIFEEIPDPNTVTQPEVQTGEGSVEPEFNTGETVEVEDPNVSEDGEEEEIEWGEPAVWPDFPSLDTPEFGDPDLNVDDTSNEDMSWLEKIGQWFKWLGEYIVEWLKWLGLSIIEWLKWLGEVIKLLPQQIFYYMKIVADYIISALKALLQQLWEWLTPLMDYLLEGLKKLFVPSEGYFDSKIEILRSKFPLADSVLGTLVDLKAFLLNLGSVPPVIYIDLSSATGSWYWGPEVVFVDLTWYAQYKPTMDAVISAFLWLLFIWRIVLSLPGIIQGTSGFWGKPEEPVAEKGLVVASQWYER